ASRCAAGAGRHGSFAECRAAAAEALRRAPRGESEKLGRFLRRGSVEQGDERSEARADVGGPVPLLVSRTEELVGDVERGERDRLQRILDPGALELGHAVLHELRELSDVVGRGLGAERERLAEERELDAPPLGHSGLSSSSLAMSFRIESTCVRTCLRSSGKRKTSKSVTRRRRGPAASASFASISAAVHGWSAPRTNARSRWTAGKRGSAR